MLPPHWQQHPTVVLMLDVGYLSTRQHWIELMMICEMATRQNDAAAENDD
jgi:hypothetical protein